MRRLILGVMLTCAAALLPAPVGWTRRRPSESARTVSGSVRIASTRCTVSAGLLIDAQTSAMNYSGKVSCPDGGGGEKTIDVVPEVENRVNGKTLWFRISLIGRFLGPLQVDPITESGSAPAVPGHVYRLLVYGEVTTEHGANAWATACAGAAGLCAGSPQLTVGSSYHYEPQGPVQVKVPGTDCVVAELGPDFGLINGTYVFEYGGTALCLQDRIVARLRLRVCVQTANTINGKLTWFTVAGTCQNQNGENTGALNVLTLRWAHFGEYYRLVSSGWVQTTKTAPTRSAIVRSGAWAP